MATYHLNRERRVEQCREEVTSCEFGSPQEHFIAAEDAHAARRIAESRMSEEQKLEALELLRQHEQALIERFLLNQAKRLAESDAAERVEIEAITTPIAIIHAAHRGEEIDEEVHSD